MNRVVAALREPHLLPTSVANEAPEKIRPRVAAFVRKAVLAKASSAAPTLIEAVESFAEPTVWFQVPRLQLPQLPSPTSSQVPQVPEAPITPTANATTKVVAENFYSLQEEAELKPLPTRESITRNLLETNLLETLVQESTTETQASVPQLLEAPRSLPRTNPTPFELQLKAKPLEAEETQAFHELATTMQQATQSIRLPLVALASLGENAATQSALMQLAVRLSEEHGRPTLLVDAAFSTSPLSHALRRERDAGLSEVLSGSHTFAELLQATSLPALDFLPVGRSISNSYAFALNSGDFAEQLHALEDRYAMILCDVGALRHPWSVAVARAADAAYLAVELGGTPMEEAMECIARFREHGGEFRGCVVLGAE